MCPCETVPLDLSHSGYSNNEKLLSLCIENTFYF